MSYQIQGEAAVATSTGIKFEQPRVGPVSMAARVIRTEGFAGEYSRICCV